MRLRLINPANSRYKVQCCDPDHVGNRWSWIATSCADLDGKPYESYYCNSCAQKRLDKDKPKAHTA